MTEYRVEPIPATEPPMSRIEDPENPDAWISADEEAFVNLTEATDEEVREAIESLEEGEA